MVSETSRKGGGWSSKSCDCIIGLIVSTLNIMRENTSWGRAVPSSAQLKLGACYPLARILNSTELKKTAKA